MRAIRGWSFWVMVCEIYHHRPPGRSIHGKSQFWSKYKDRAGLCCGHTAGQYDLISNTII